MAETTVGLLRVVLSSNSAEFSKDMGAAGKSVDTFDKQAKSAGKSLAGMASGFDGSKLANDANKVANAVHNVGDRAGFATRGMQLLVGLFSARAIVNATRDVIAHASSLNDLAGKSGISAEALQRLGYVTAQSGITLEQVAQAAVLLAKNLVGGNKSAVAAVEALGFKVRDLITMGPEKAFLAIGEAIAKVPNPMERAALATAAFGRSGAEFLPAFTSNMSALADQAQRSGAVLEDELVQAADDAGDAVDRFQAVGLALIGRVLIPMLPAIEAVANWLGANLPPALEAARAGINSLIVAGLRFEVWLAETAASITRTAAEVPILGRAFGQTSADVTYFEERARTAKDTLAAFTAQGVEPAAASMGKATGITTGYSDALERTGRAAKKAKEDLSIVSGLVDPLTMMLIQGVITLDQYGASTDNAGQALDELAAQIAKVNGLVHDQNGALVLASRSIMSYGQATTAARQAAQDWANTNGAVLAPSIKQITPAMLGAGEATGNFFTRLFGGSEQLSSRVTQLFSQAFTGGAGALGAIKAFATEGMAALLGMIPGVGPWVSAFAGPIIAMLSKLTKKFTDFFKRMFGGPSAAEMEGRSQVAAFEDELASVLTAQQKAEAGGEAWKATVIAIRDAYIAAGRSEEEALRDAERLWAASQDGGEDALAVIEEIRRKMQQLTSETHEIEVEVKYTGTAPEGAARPGEPESHTLPVDPGFATGTAGRFGNWFKDFGRNFPTRLHGVEAVLRPQDALPFAQSVLGNLSPLEGSNTNNVNVLPVIMGSQMSPREIGRAAVGYLKSSGLPNDESGITSAIESVIDNWMRTYRYA